VHPKVAELGLHRFLTIAGVHKLPLSNTAMSSFHLAWNAGLAQYQSVQREIALPQAVALLTAFLSLSEPLHLLLAGFRFDAATVHWAHVVRLVGLVWFGLSVTFLLTTIGCAVYSTESMRRLRHASMQLVADYPVHRLFVSHVVDSQPLACSVAYVLPGTKTVVVVALLVLLASGVPWLFIPFWGWRPIDSVLQALPTVAQHSLHRGAGDETAADGGALMRLGLVTGSSVVLMLSYLVRQLVRECRDMRPSSWEALDPADLPMRTASKH
jgi:hypothetical protein